MPTIDAWTVFVLYRSTHWQNTKWYVFLAVYAMSLIVIGKEKRDISHNRIIENSKRDSQLKLSEIIFLVI